VDPLSAMLLALMVSGMTVQTVTASLADRRAARAGRTPPSKQQHNQRQDQRAAAGQSRQPDPGPWRRRWRNAAETRTEKAAQKQAARMEYLRDNAETTKAAHRKRIERRAARRAQLGTILAGWGESTWEGTKNAAVQAREARTERKAWKQNARHQAGDTTSGTTDTAAPVPPPRTRQSSSTATVDTDAPRRVLDPVLSGTQQQLVDQWRNALSSGRLHDATMAREDWDSLPEPMRDTLIHEAWDAGHMAVNQAEDGSTTPERGDDPRRDPRYGRLRITTDSDGSTRTQSGRDVEGNSNIYGVAIDPSTWTGTDRYGRDIQTGRGESRDVTEPGGPQSVVHDDDLTGTASPEREAVKNHWANTRRQTAQTEQPPAGNNPAGNSTTEHTEGGTTMSQSGEITDLPSAISYCQSTASYCDQITSTFEQSQSQARQAVQDLQQQLSSLENAQSSLAGQGMNGEIQTRLAAMQEKFASLTSQLQQTEQLLSATQEEITSARSDARSASQALESQQGIAEQVQSQQNNGVATNTDFYANA